MHPDDAGLEYFKHLIILLDKLLIIKNIDLAKNVNFVKAIILIEQFLILKWFNLANDNQQSGQIKKKIAVET